MEDIMICLDLPALLVLVFLIGGGEVASSASTAIALFPFFAPGMMERVWSRILLVSLGRRYWGQRRIRSR